MPALPVPGETDLRALPVGRCEDGAAFAIRLHGTHLLIAGATGAGKGSYLWCLVRAMLPAMAAGLVQIWACDPKLMELAFGRALFDRYGRYASDPADIADLLEEAVADMQARARRFAGRQRDHTASAEFPFTVIMVDEIAFLRNAAAYPAHVRPEPVGQALGPVKVGDQGLGWLAADRSMQAARASEDPVTVASSARIVTHALMGSKHYKAATDTASTLAARFDHDVSAHDPESLSVYGSLLLRGAIAAAQQDNRGGADELLTEAEDAAARLGDDLNLRWTAFGPTNASLHRVNIAVTLGDAGTAIDVARTVDLSRIDVTERKATFLMDTARAFLQCGRHERAYLTSRSARPRRPRPRRSPGARSARRATPQAALMRAAGSR